MLTTLLVRKYFLLGFRHLNTAELTLECTIGHICDVAIVDDQMVLHNELSRDRIVLAPLELGRWSILFRISGSQPFGKPFTSPSAALISSEEFATYIFHLKGLGQDHTFSSSKARGFPLKPRKIKLRRRRTVEPSPLHRNPLPAGENRGTPRARPPAKSQTPWRSHPTSWSQKTPPTKKEFATHIGDMY